MAYIHVPHALRDDGAYLYRQKWINISTFDTAHYPYGNPRLGYILILQVFTDAHTNIYIFQV